MSVKAAIDVVPPLQREALQVLVSEWDFGTITNHRKLYGGFSGSNYFVENAAGERAVLKLMHGYPFSEVQSVAKVQAYLPTMGFASACSSIARPAAVVADKGGSLHVSTTVPDSPMMLLTYVDGVAADTVLRDAAPGVGTAMLRGAGRALAQLHSLPVPKGAAALREAEVDGGCCLVKDHIDGTYLTKVQSVTGHAYVAMYEAALVELRSAMATEGLPRGICHGDPFLDNMLCDAATGEMRGFVDFEDAAIGPLLFDVACMCVAASFVETGVRGETWQRLDTNRLRFILEGYCAVRPFAAAESALFTTFMRVALLCNATWRFVNFNVDHPEMTAQRNAHAELAERIVAMQSDVAQRAVQACVDGAQPINVAFLFIKPHAVTAEVEALLRARCERDSIEIVDSGALSASEMDQRGVVDRHYGQLTRRAMAVPPAQLPALSDKVLAVFSDTFGISWAHALAQGTLVNCRGLYAAHAAAGSVAVAADSVGAADIHDAFALETLWRSAACVKLFPGTYAARVVANGLSHIVVNGFYPAMRSKFCDVARAPNGVKWFVLSWREVAMDWAAFRGEWVGATNPAKAARASLRGELFANWEEYGIAAAPFGADNGFHASASPVEACYERCLWLGAPIDDDPLMHAAKCAGISSEIVTVWCSGDAVIGDTPVFDVVELLGTSAVLKAMAKAGAAAAGAAVGAAVPQSPPN